MAGAPVTNWSAFALTDWLDELSMPGALLAEVMQRLYRDNDFLRGTLMLDGRRVAVEDLWPEILRWVHRLAAESPSEAA